MKYDLTPKEQETRLNARWEIIRVANLHRMRTHAGNPYAPKMMGMKNIQQAVHVCRQGMLVSGKVLMEAGFEPHVVKSGSKMPGVLKRLIGEK